MQTKSHAFQTFWNTTLRALVRTVLGGLAAAAVGGLFCLACGAVLCWATGMPLGFAGASGTRGAFAGLAAGMIVGAISGIYHGEKPQRAGAQVEICKEKPASCNPAPAPPLMASVRNSNVHMRLG